MKIKIKETFQFAAILAIFSFIFCVTAFFADQKGDLEDHFSAQSIEKIEEIAAEYELYLAEDLGRDQFFAFGRGHFYADTLSASDSKITNLGILTKLYSKSDNSWHVFNWKPVKSLSKEELLVIANAFASSVPEIDIAEPDVKISTPVSFIDGIEVSEEYVDVAEDSFDLDDEAPLIAIIDSGIYRYHEDFDQAAIYKEYNLTTNNNDVDDFIGHGSHIAGLIAQETDSPLMILSIFDPETQDTSLSEVVSALKYANDKDADIVNLSLGISDHSSLLQDVVEELYEDGVVLVAASGNDGELAKYYPAAYEEVIAVAAVDHTGKKYSKSNYGNWVDYSALGKSVLSHDNAESGYVYMSGTSQSAAFVTAFIANLMQDYDFDDVDELRAMLDAEVSTFGNIDGYEGLLGKGILK